MQELRKIIIEIIIEEILSHANEIAENPIDIDDKTKPLEEVVGFDSLVGVLVSVECIDRLDAETDARIDIELDNLFIGKDKNGNLYARSVEQIADFIISKI